MSSLRRDLFERRLWPVVALLVAAVIAAPVLLLKSASASGTSTPVPSAPAAPAAAPGAAAAPTTSAAHAAKTVRVKQLVASMPRDPFASGMAKLSSKPSPQTNTSAGTASSTPATSASKATASSAGTPVAMVSPSPAVSSTTTTSTTTATTPAATAATTPATAPSTVSSAPRSETSPAKDQSWTLYSLSMRFGKDTSARLRTNVARLTPLPSAKQPDVMFMGVMAGGKQAVFALGAGVGHTGPGLCRPDRTRCSAIVLKAGQTEQITIPSASGAARQVVLRVVRIAGRVTHSRKVALAAYQRHSAAGQCALALADPVSYSPTDGTVSSAVTAACRNQPSTGSFSHFVTGP
jgi:hypothetical protein